MSGQAKTQQRSIKAAGIRRLLMALAMTFCVVHGAWAEGVSPKYDNVITGDNVTVGDVFSGVTQDAGYVLAPAPAYGKSLTLGPADLQRVSDAFNLGWYPKNGHEQVVIRRSSHVVDHFMIEAALDKALAADLDGQKFDVALDKADLALNLPESAPATVSVSNLKYDMAHSSFTAVLTAPAGAEKTSGQPAVRRAVSGRIFAVTAVPVLKNARMAGDIITAQDIDYVDTRSDDISANVITDAARLIGMMPRRAIAALKPVTASDVVQPPLVKKGETITMQLKSDTMVLTTQGKALEDGVEGETVRVVNTSSNQVIQGVVTGMKTVTVAAPATARVAGQGT
ncbi:MAG: flagellar basal body P-ring formation protein FlgA [Alphaproteobacteria bacterium]|nr:flagellar basal body P-ring formation protein FlgA [Alphaproteobacteria bacterium]